MVTIKTTLQIRSKLIPSVSENEANIYWKKKWALVEEQKKEYDKLVNELKLYLKKWDNLIIPMMVSRGFTSTRIEPSFDVIVQKGKKVLFGEGN